MEQKEVQCTFCGYTMKMGAHTKGVPSIECPACGKLIMFSEELASAEESRLSLNQNIGAARPKKDCPHCGGAVDPESVICIHCGYNWLIGKTHQEQHAISPYVKWASLGAVIIAVLAVVVMIFQRVENGSSGQDEFEVMTPAADVSQGDNAGMQMPEDGVLAAEEQEAGSELTKDLIAIPDRPGFSDEDRTRLQDYRDKMFTELERKYPVYQKKQQVKLRQGNGRIRRGEYLGIKSNILVLVEGSSAAEIPLALLDRDTRLHCDEAFRKQYIHSRLRRAAQKIQRDNVTKDVEAESL